MKLLICTQAVDVNHDILGFFHSWIVGLSKHFEQITVICLEEGEHKLPKNVKVLSLGKEGGVSRSKYIKRFFKYIWQERQSYDKVFVHMNSEYALMGGMLWKLWGKKCVLWNNHQVGHIITRLAVRLVHVVCYTSPFAYTSRYKNSRIMPAGIDTDIFKESQETKREKNSILSLGRISPVKNIDTLIQAAIKLDEKNRDFVLNIYGESTDEVYFKKIKELARELEKKGKIRFCGKVRHSEAPDIYRKHEIFVNLTNSGSLDKTTLEAMACGCVPVVSNEYYKDIIDARFMFKERDAEGLAVKLEHTTGLTETETREITGGMVGFVEGGHSLHNLIKKIVNLYKT